VAAFSSSSRNSSSGSSSNRRNGNTVNTKFSEVPPLKAAMLVNTWQRLMLDVEEKVGVVPELGTSSVSIRSVGRDTELPRRILCKGQYQRFYESTYALALADKNNDPEVAKAKRKAIPSLTMDGTLCGPDCITYASLTTPATMALVVQLEQEWSILALTVNPTERNMGIIVAAETVMLEELRQRAKEAGVSLRLQASAQETLAGTMEQLNLVPLPAPSPPVNGSGSNTDAITWYQC
jgi:hypothetical protein